MSDAAVRMVTEAVGPDALSFGDHLEEWSVGGATPAAVVTPGSVEEVASVLRSAHGVTVVPVGGGTHLGSRPPPEPFIVLSTRRLAGVEIYEPGDLTLTAGGGSTLAELGDVLAGHGQWLPFDPPRAPERTLGGLVATGSASPLWAGYGAPRDHVLGATIVTGDGRVLRLGGRVMKNVAGFDLVRLVVGSRGTLGVVVSACLRVFPRPAVDRLLIVRARSAEELVEASRRVATAPFSPVSAVLAEPGAPGGAILAVRIHGARGAVDADEARLEQHLGRPFEVLEGAAASPTLHYLQDHAFALPLVVRMSSLPSRLADVIVVARSLPHGAMSADAMAGRMRVGTSVLPPRAVEWVAGARLEMQKLGGTLVVERAPADVAAAMTIADGEEQIAQGLRAHFDPAHVFTGERLRQP